MTNGAEGYHKVQEAIAAAAEMAGRAADDVTLVAVSKVQPVDVIRPVLEAGHRTFGENRVQEAQEKWPALRDAFSGVTLHLIGPLQTNKAEDAVALFDVIETLDRPKLARKLADAIKKVGRTPKLYIQVNTGEETQKAGVLPGDLDALLAVAQDECGLVIDGLMCIPPVEETPALHFALLDKLAAERGLTVRSMGMSGDFETGVKFGATHVRVGTAVFGQRVTP
ncbi:MAG: YggS family pyridoxal phosphate-dependent enzyme [Alphaproteobacteria bacterium]